MIPYYENDQRTFRHLNLYNFNFPPHLHSHIEIIYIEEGELYVTIDSTTKLMQKGDFAIAFPNRIHSYNTPKDGSCHITLAIFPVEQSGDYMSYLLKQYPSHPFIKRQELHKDIPYIVNSLQELTPELDQGIIKAYFQLILARTLTFMQLKPNRDYQPPDRTAKLITYLSENFLESLSLDQLAVHFGISKYSISRIFSDKLHTSFCDYINTLRINYAENLLTRTDVDILTISYQCGYDNPRTFNRAFKSVTGCSPREYRKKNTSIYT